MTAAATPGRLLGYSFSFNLDGTKDNQNNVVVQTHFDADASLETINGTIDKILATVERARAVNDLARIEIELEHAERMYIHLPEDIARITKQKQDAWTASGKPGKVKFTPRDQTELQNVEVNQNALKTTIERLRNRKSVLESIVGPHIRADRKPSVSDGSVPKVPHPGRTAS